MKSSGNYGGKMPVADNSRKLQTDAAIPNVARMWDYYLGGTDHSEAERDAARIVLGAAPDVPLAALENREFLKHAVRFLTEEAHISQFVDIGPGLPTQGNIHQLARKHLPDAHVVYVDNDPVVLEHGRAQVAEIPGVTLIEGDLRHPESILQNAELRELIDFSKPISLCMTLVLHFITEEENPYQIVTRLAAHLPPGSCMMISHVTGDDHGEDTQSQISGIYNHASAPLTMRSRAQFLRFFEGFELIEPGVVFLSQWRPTTSHYAGGGTRWAYAGVGLKSCSPDDAVAFSQSRGEQTELTGDQDQ